MLRIVRTEPSSGGCLLQVEGRLVGPWVDELRRTCDAALASAGRVALDLTHLAYADHDGVKLLQALGRREVALVNCSPFVSEQLKAGAQR